ncbi:MAG TPA: hypothetical protein VK404_08800 [Spirosoma sp.]|nr:hypothetical protein [Spirosoma sp.]
MNDLETIENYVTGKLPEDERTRFETALRTDPALADALAFYVLAKHTAKVDARAQRQAELDALRRSPTTPHLMTDLRRTITRPLWSAPMRWAAAASVVLLQVLGWLIMRPTNSVMMANRLADEYVAQHFIDLPTTMDGSSSGSPTVDSVKLGIGLFNNKKLADADAVFNDILKRQPTNDNALKLAGIVSLRQGNYDKAINLFHRLSQRTDLYSNPGLFYESLALLKRNRPMDKEKAKKLLEDVISRNLEGKQEAKRLIESL